ncbi:unnamed protein product [Mesocestoides corti]|uniref:Uncharacterized protein n=1 Tax=Mesocestoides corti TaxID=53468 RepID=A0A3P6H4G5_MESCO|nr:unnamed protein product [Mesocestoides corti]
MTDDTVAMANIVEQTRKLVKDDEECVEERRNKWICLPGPHHPEYFENYCVTEDPSRIFENRPKEHWKFYMPNRGPIDPYRIWKIDKRGFRHDDWYNAPNDCFEKNEKARHTFIIVKYTWRFYTAYYRENHHNLIPRSEQLTDFWERHPARLLNDFVYRKPDYYIKHTEETQKNCLNKQVPPFKAPSRKKISERCLMRLQFATNNYRTIDDGFAVDFNE